MYQIPAPEQFSFRPDDWNKWIDRFERFRSASGLKSKEKEEQVNSLIYLMGAQSEEILASFNMTDAQKKDYDVVKTKFDQHFVPTRNVIYERYKFHTRSQEEGESVEHFITALHSLAQTCEFPASFHDEMIRDRIVCGIRDKKVSENLQLDTKLTLEKAVTQSRQAEIIKGQQVILGNDSSSFKVANRIAVTQKNQNNRPKQTNDKYRSTPKYSNSSQSATSKTKEACFWCGKNDKHSKQECPARKAICNKCKKTGHYAKVCKSKLQVNQLEGTKPTAFLGHVLNSINNNAKFCDRWTAKVVIDDTSIDFKIDSGAEVTVIPKNTYDSKLKHIKLFNSKKVICGPDGGNLNLAGVLHVDLKNKNLIFKDKVYVVSGLQHSLLSCAASEHLNLIQRIFQVNSQINPVEEFPKLFSGLGKVEKPYKIKLKENAKPYAICVPRRVPLALRSKLQKLLEQMTKDGIIEAVDEPTEWCAPMVIVPKKSGDIRICVDLSVLNDNIEREYFPMASVDYTLSQFSNAKVFSVIDANAGFWQISLDEDSTNLTTFISPFGRYKFRRLPFGIKSAPEVFQKRIRETVPDGPGIVGLMDEFVIFGATEEEHDKRLREVLSKLQAAGWTLNAEKCQFKVKEVKFLGHVISSEGIKPDPNKTEAIANLPRPNSVKELKRFLGMSGFLSKFIPKMADIANPLYELLKNNVEWIWGPAQEASFQRIKEELCQTPGLSMFDLHKEIYISCDASSYGLGAVLYHMKEGYISPICYASRTLSNAEKRYAQIEKEALAIIWSCDRFRDYIIGKQVHIETDHKPLVPIFMSKPLDTLTPRLQRIKLRMMRYDFSISHKPGKELVIADTLSRSPISENGEEELSEEIAAYVQNIIDTFPASDERLAEIVQLQNEDPICKMLIKYCKEGWPSKNEILVEIQRFWEHRHSLSLQNQILFKDARIVIPVKLQREILDRIHDGHQGITKCRARAQQSVWWPGISKEIETLVRNCANCIQYQSHHKEPLIPSSFPERPWQVVAADLLKLKGHWYVIVADYYSRYFEVGKLENLTSVAVIEHMKSIFARHGIPEIVRSDNGTQFSQVIDSKYFKFAKTYKFSILTSSPKFPQSNGFIESMVKNFKNHFLKSQGEDPYLMLLAIRSTPLENGYSPAELLMGRKLRTPIPATNNMLMPNIADFHSLREKEVEMRERKKRNFDEHHGARNLPPLEIGQPVWVKDIRSYGKVKSLHTTPRSYIVETPRGEFRRNRIHLHPSSLPLNFSWNETTSTINPELSKDSLDNVPSTKDNVEMPDPVVDTDTANSDTPAAPELKIKKTRSGRIVNIPKRFLD